MKNIFRIFLGDIQSIVRNIIAFIVIIGISVLPALYSWFNIASNWDPYSATGNLMFAVCSNDKGYTFKSISVNAGDKLIEKLKANDKMGWKFVDEQEAIDGVDKGRYYAAVVIPENFSEDLLSITTGEFVQSKIDYYVNEKINAISPKITNTGVNTVVSELKAAYVEEVTNIIAKTLNITTDEVVKNKDTVLKKLIEDLTKLSAELGNFDSGMGVFENLTDTLQSLLEANLDIMPGLSDIILSIKSLGNDLESVMNSTKSFNSRLVASVEEIINSVETLYDDIDNRLKKVFDGLESGSKDAADELIQIGSISRKIISINSYLKIILQGMQSSFGVDMSFLINKLDSINEHQQAIQDKLINAADLITSTGKLPKEIQDDIRKMVTSGKNEIALVKMRFGNLKSSINSSVNDLYKTIDKLSDFLSNTNHDLPKLEKTITSSIDVLKDLKKTFSGAKEIIADSKKDIDDLIKKAESIENEDELLNFVRKIVGNPDALSGFFSDPAEAETHRMYAIDNYGTAMSPFYTSLGIWVGGIVLSAIISLELKKKRRLAMTKLNGTQVFFGRYIIFFLISQLQSLIISLGDLYFLGIQCSNKTLFILGCMISGFVYSIIIYSLTAAFNVIGKAISVIILVLQVAGSGGTFPIQLLPQPFQDIAPFLPFRYGNDILREAIAGPDMSNYWRNVLLLLCFVPAALFIGLIIRLPLIKVMDFFEKRLHQSDIVL
jgi:putative membrane protein